MSADTKQFSNLQDVAVALQQLQAEIARLQRENAELHAANETLRRQIGRTA